MVPVFIEAPYMKAYRVVKVHSWSCYYMEFSGQLHIPAALLLLIGPPRTHWIIGGWVGPTASLDVLENRKISCLCWESNQEFSVSSSQSSYINVSCTKCESLTFPMHTICPAYLFLITLP